MIWVGILGAVAVVAILVFVLGKKKEPEAPKTKPNTSSKSTSTEEKPKKPASEAPAANTEALPKTHKEDEDEVELTLVHKPTVTVEEHETPRLMVGEDLGPESEVMEAVENYDYEPEDQTGVFTFIFVAGVAQTDKGMRRQNNEDSFYSGPKHQVFVVADGMGGYEGGEIASKVAVETIEKCFESKQFPGEPHPKRPRRGDELVRAIEGANLAVVEEKSKNARLRDMGTTLVAARFSPNKERVYIANVGDSRCYRIRDNDMAQMTVDHTVGQVTGLTGPVGAQLTRAVGLKPKVSVDLRVDKAEPGDVFLLCSDGLTKMVDDQTIKQICKGQDPEVVAKALVSEANARGGKDNITVIVVRILDAREGVGGRNT